MIGLTYIGFTHRTAPLGARERITPPADEIETYARQVQAFAPESAVLRTCGRFETFLAAESRSAADAQPAGASAAPGIPPILAILSARSGMPVPALRRHAMILDGDRVVAHLFRVAAGLDSPMLGEDHVLGQVSTCLTDAQRRGTAGPILSALLRSAIRAGRRARNESGLRQVASSFTGQAARLLRERAASEKRPRSLLVIGSGAMAAEMLDAVKDAGWSRIVVAGRHASRTGELAARAVGRAVDLDSVAGELAWTDCVVACTSSTTLLLTTAVVRDSLRQRGACDRRNLLLLIDLGMPRNVEPDVARLPGVELLDLEGLARRSGQDGGSAVETAKARATAVLDEERTRFMRWGENRQRHGRIGSSAPSPTVERGDAVRADETAVGAPARRVAV
ncbi:MAG: Glutamyl-tRNA reductase [Phycisphaerae bacterium]|nr:Glutamyl-tRNA reductase [Phycisphaerae bacterium]